MGYTLYFKEADLRCNEVFKTTYYTATPPACFLPKGHLGPHVAWNGGDFHTTIWWSVVDGKQITVEDLLKRQK